MGLDIGSGAGNHLPTPALVISGVSTLIAVVVSVWSIFLHLKNYRKPVLQRMVIRIIVMVPIYAISSLISIFSVQAAFFIDVARDIYEAFVIYCFFVLLLDYLGGERALLIMLHGRPPKDPVFPANLFQRELDVSDPFTFLFLKRGILQYVQVKPILAIVTVILKLANAYNEGSFRSDSGYLYISVIYNTSICLALYCLAVFWMCVAEDLRPFRPMPKFLCVKGILFFSFWQSILISTLVSVGAITRLGPYTEREHISVALTDILICVEMPLFAFAHMFAFSYKDFLSKETHYVARMPFYYAIRDAIGLVDVIEDTKATLRGEGIDYRAFEPSEGYMHQGVGRDRRIKAGLRYSKGGKQKYWLPRPEEPQIAPGRIERGVNNIIKTVAGRDQAEEVYAPLLGDEADDVVHLARDMMDDSDGEEDIYTSAANHTSGGLNEAGWELEFGDPDAVDEELYNHSKGHLFGDYNYPCIDVSSEQARLEMWDEEERVLRDERGALFSPIRGAKGLAAIEERGSSAWNGYGAVGTSSRPVSAPSAKAGPKERHVVVDHDDARLPAQKKDDLGLKWTRSRPSTPSRTASPSKSPSAVGSSSGNAPHLHSSRSSKTNLHSKTHRSSPLASPTTQSGSPKALPPDAVDLIVEDPDAVAEQEHHPGDRTRQPPMTGLKKVYRRGFDEDEAEGSKHKGGSDSDDDSPKQIEIEDNRPDDGGVGRVEVGEKMVRDMGGEAELSPKEESEVEGVKYGRISPSREREEEEDGAVIARVSTPPVHARVYVDDNDNPWA